MTTTALTYRSPGGLCQGPIVLNKQNYYAILHGVNLHIYDADGLCSTYSLVGSCSLERNGCFRVVTIQNTMVDIVSNDRPVWLDALQSGLELALMFPHWRPASVLPLPQWKRPKKKQLFKAQITVCVSCGSEHPTASGPVLYFKKCESKVPLCQNCGVNFGLLNYMHTLHSMTGAYQQERDALIKAQELCVQCLKDDPTNVEPLKVILHSPTFDQYCITNSSIAEARANFLQGTIGTSELLEHLDGQDDVQLIELKQAAFENCGGDMGTAMKLLLESITKSDAHDKLLSVVLDFLYKNRTSVGFFWPQICHLHLRMLPPPDARMLQKVQLVEDFLLKICDYSIHLALELMWSHSADLEESLGSESPSQNCSKRKYAVLRFVHELESRLLGEDVYTTGTSIVLGKLFQATPLQLKLLRNSARLLRPPCQDEHDQPLDATQKLQKIQRADYFASHLTFSRRLADVAEKLRFMEIKERSSFLQNELELLNASGSMGGDPLNRIRESLIRVVRVPSTEGHVFRSKERTPVLLLMEVIDEEAVEQGDAANDMASLREEPSTKETKSDASPSQQAPLVSDEANGAVESSNEESLVVGKVAQGDVATTEETPVLENGNAPSPVKKQSQEQDESSPPDAIGAEPAVEHRKEDELVPLAIAQAAESEVDVRNGDQHFDDQVSTGEAERSTAGSEMFYSAHDEDDPVVVVEESMTEEAKVAVTVETEKIDAIDSAELSAVANALNNDEDPALMEEDSPRRSDPPGLTALGNALEGHQPASPGPKALVRFNSGGERIEKGLPATPKDDVERIVNSVAQEQLKELVMPSIELNDDRDECGVVETPVPPQNPPTEAEPGRRGSSRLGSLSGTDPTDVAEANNTLAPTGDIRRAVLTTIMMQGIQGNTIAAAAADSVQRSLKELERKRATALLFGDEDAPTESEVTEGIDEAVTESTRQKLMSLGVNTNLEEVYLASRPTEEDEVLESIRLMLIQNQVAQGQLSPSDAAKVLQHTSLSPLNATKSSKSFDQAESIDLSDHPTIDAGDVDPRLVGCGPLPPAVLQAMTLWKGGVVSHAELLELVKKDIEFVKHSVLVDAEDLDKLQENSAFWGRFSFGERWAEKKARIGSSSPQGKIPGWDICGVIVKSNDDLRQEAFVMQLIELSKEAFELAELELWISPYRILATGRTTGVIECVRNAMSFDALKKRPGYGKGGLREHLRRMTEFTADPGEAFKTAQQNFVRSLAAYSLLSYFFLFKDRHNGNLLLDTAGHVIHIDFGFVFGIAPGGSFSLEMSTPFKLTEEMLDVMGGLRSPLFSEFVTLFCCGFLALQSYSDTFMTLVEITSKESTFKCFEGQNPSEVMASMRERFVPDLTKEETVSFALDLIKQATTSYGTRQYDLYQYISQGIVA